MRIRHGVAAREVGGRSCLARLKFASLASLEIEDLVAIPIDDYRARGPHDCRSAVAIVVLHALAALVLPRNHLVAVVEAGNQRVIKFPIVIEVVSSTRRGDAAGIIDAQRPAANVHLMRAIVQGLARAVKPQPMPVIRMDIVLVRPARRWSLPQIPVQLRRNGHYLADAHRLSHVVVPGFGKVGPADQAVVNLLDNLDGVRRGALLDSHLRQLSVLPLGSNQHLPFSGIVAAWLLHINVFARFESRNRHGSMPVVRRGDGDGVHILLLKDATKVLVHGRSIAQLALHAIGKFLQNHAVHIANMRDAGGILVRLERGKVGIGAAIQANHRKVKAVVGAKNPSIALRGTSNRQASRSHCKRIHKFTPGYHFVSPSKKSHARLKGR